MILSARGKEKFTLDGSYFQQLGQEYGSQNPLYTIRTFPTHLSAMDGTKPFSEYTGGVLAVLQKETEQFTEFSDRWYLKDFLTKPVSADAPTKADAKIDPCEGLRETAPHCGWKPHWSDSGVSTNAIDGTKTEFLSLDSSDADGLDFGRLHYAELRLCFKNGKLCRDTSVGASVNVHGMVASMSGSSYSTPVRLRFDDEQPLRAVWGITDDHDALFPYGREREFLSQLLRHNKLIVEFSYYQKAPRTVMFELSGLAEKMKSETLEDPTPEINAKRRSESAVQAKLVATQAAGQKELEQERDVEDKRLAVLRQKCSAFVDGSPEKIQQKVMSLPPKECREVLRWMRDGYLDALYDLQR